MIWSKKRVLSGIFLVCSLFAARAEGNRSEQLRRLFLDGQSDEVMIIAHRGAWRAAPENSIPAITACIERGIDIVELDIQLSADGVPVLMHDTTVDRTTNGRGRVSDLTLAQLKKLRLADHSGRVTNLQIPTLEEAMAAASGKILVNLDKAYRYMNEVMEVLERGETVRQVILKGSDSPGEMVHSVAQLHPDLIFMPVVKLAVGRGRSDKRVLQYIEQLNPPAVELVFAIDSYRALRPRFIAAMKQRGVRPWCNTLWDSISGGHSDPKPGGSTASWDWVVNRGFTLIQTDRPFMLLEYLQGRGLHR